ncbi:MAG TPA: hypothetical protein VGP62_01500 [Bryobacteraceae bacterium]|jgi:hypothetical protein|nr:hypothetical protein [Bryobacteraceae bacterium]
MGKSQRCDFFAVTEDLIPVLQAVESRYAIKYVQYGLFDQRERPVYYGHSRISSLGIAEAGDANFERGFLVLRNDDMLNVREVPQRTGGTKYAVDQRANGGTITLRPGGKYGDSAVIAGLAGTVHHDPVAEELIRAFLKAFRATFVKMESYSVGPAARKLLGTGVRFTASIHSPTEFDLSNDSKASV